MNRPMINPDTAEREDLVLWILDDADEGALREWAAYYLESLYESDLRRWVRDALPEAEPLPPTRSLTDTERAVLRGMLP